MALMCEYEHEVLGRLVIAGDGEAVIALWIEGQKYFGAGVAEELSETSSDPVLMQARDWLDRYFAGDRPAPSELPLKPRGTEFQLRVWRALQAIPYGEVRTYAQVAQQLSRESGAAVSPRAVGTANGRNPISVIVPCHRVIGSDKSLVGYAAGIQKKAWLLSHEGVDVSKLRLLVRGTAL